MTPKITLDQVIILTRLGVVSNLEIMWFIISTNTIRVGINHSQNGFANRSGPQTFEYHKGISGG